MVSDNDISQFEQLLNEFSLRSFPEKIGRQITHNSPPFSK